MVDYEQNCVKSGSCACKLAGRPPYQYCITVGTSCECKCPDPKPNSHVVSNNCGSWTATCGSPTGCPCSCQGTCKEDGSQTCKYDCDAGYEWNPVTQTCDLKPAVAKRRLLGVGT